jgi:hypothetical protein
METFFVDKQCLGKNLPLAYLEFVLVSFSKQSVCRGCFIFTVQLKLASPGLLHGEKI